MNETLTTIQYAITFYSQWHCGSGLSAGADVDELTVKDRNGMPFVPGKTLKGLVREAVENYLDFTDASPELREMKDMVFGAEVKDAAGDYGKTACAHFGNAELCKDEYGKITEAQAQRYMYGKITTTSIDNNGIAKDKSLRSEETVVPCTLYAEISGVPARFVDIITESMKLIKRMGQKRNRGLGRCDFKAENRKGGRQ